MLKPDPVDAAPYPSTRQISPNATKADKRSRNLEPHYSVLWSFCLTINNPFLKKPQQRIKQVFGQAVEAANRHCKLQLTVQQILEWCLQGVPETGEQQNVRWHFRNRLLLILGLVAVEIIEEPKSNIRGNEGFPV